MASPKILTDKSSVDGTLFVGKHNYKIGHEVPIYEVFATGALNQLIGHAKFDNAQYGNVYYRGVSGLYDNVLPALMRNRARGIPDDLISILKTISEHKYFIESLKLRQVVKENNLDDKYLNKHIRRINKYCVEALLQHYAGNTRFLDIVDNHWVAIWMGLHSFRMRGRRNMYCEVVNRVKNVYDIYDNILNGKHADSDSYVYLLLLAMPHPKTIPVYGISKGDEFVEVDLRKALPSIYLRPHAQHALVVRKIDKHNIYKKSSYYDLAKQVIGIIKIRVDIASEWIGNGLLLTQQNLFPSPSIDQGYNNLLMNPEIFTHPFEIIKYF